MNMDLLQQFIKPAKAARDQLTGWRRWASETNFFGALKRFYQKLANAGTHGYPPDIRRRLVVMNLIAYLIAISTFGYAVQHIFLDWETYKPVIYLNLVLLAISLLVPFCHRFSDLAGAYLIVVSELIALFVFTYYMGREAGIQLQYFVFAAATFVVFGVRRWRLVLPLISLATILELFAWFMFPQDKAAIKVEQGVIDGIYIQAAITTAGLIAAAIFYAFSLAEQAKAETDALLRRILPDSVVERLKKKPGEPIADNIGEATILFADIKGFVALARELGAEDTVKLLNEIVMKFDALAKKHGVEKIKTIGDAYMAAAGIPEPVSDHAERLTRMGLDMLVSLEEISKGRGLDLKMRIGMASGPVMAGVIGTHKFGYDVWGDTVNLAARLEKLSEPGRILICPECHAKLNNKFEFESHGKIPIKGVGLQETWFIANKLNVITNKKSKKTLHATQKTRSKRSASA